MMDENNSLLSLINSTSKTVFSTQDFNKAWKYENYRSLIRRLNYMSNNGTLIKIKRGLYSIAGRPVNELELANKLRAPSYISFETALYKHGVIFQWDPTITVAGNQSIVLNALDYKIVFRQLKDYVLLTMQGIEKIENYYIASKERAILDMLYIDPTFTFDNLRAVDFEKIKSLVPLYKTPALLKIVESLEEHVRSY